MKHADYAEETGFHKWRKYGFFEKKALEFQIMSS